MRAFKSKKIIFLFLLTSFTHHAQGAHAARALKRLALYNGLIGIPLAIWADKLAVDKDLHIQTCRQEDKCIPLKQFQEEWVREKIAEETEIPEGITLSLGKAYRSHPNLNHVILNRWDLVTTMLHDPKVSKKLKDKATEAFSALLKSKETQESIFGLSDLSPDDVPARPEELATLKAATLHELQHVKDRKKLQAHYLIYLPSTALALLHTPLPFKSRAVRALATVGMKLPFVAAGTILTSRALSRHRERRADTSVRDKPHLAASQVTEHEKDSQYSGQSARITSDCQRLLGNNRGQKTAEYLKKHPALLFPWAIWGTHPLCLQRAAYHRKWAEEKR